MLLWQNVCYNIMWWYFLVAMDTLIIPRKPQFYIALIFIIIHNWFVNFMDDSTILHINCSWFSIYKYKKHFV